jgi:hypothetical protein
VHEIAIQRVQLPTRKLYGYPVAEKVNCHPLKRNLIEIAMSGNFRRVQEFMLLEDGDNVPSGAASVFAMELLEQRLYL